MGDRCSDVMGALMTAQYNGDKIDNIAVIFMNGTMKVYKPDVQIECINKKPKIIRIFKALHLFDFDGNETVITDIDTIKNVLLRWNDELFEEVK